VKNKKKRRQFLRSLDPYIPVILLILTLTGWEFAARMGWISPLFFPSPSRIGAYIVKMTLNGDLGINLLATIQRLFLGFLAGAIPGIILGLTMGWSHRLGKIIDPIIAALHPIPKVAIFPVIMIIFGIGEISKIVAIGIAAFFPVLINSMTSVRQFNPIYFEVSRNYGASRWKTFTRVVVPGSLPTVLSGIRIALNLSMVITITVELISARTGLGVLIFFAWQTLRIEQLYATLFITALLGISINFILQTISSKLVPWAETSKWD
jgi:ABC-type nitrate/sulfonate/bicarbonate transport system permease component